MKEQITFFDKPTENTVIFGDAVKGLQILPAESVDTCITSPPYFNLRDYGEYGQIGLETTGILQKTQFASCKPKDLIGIPWMLAFALRADGWYLRQDIIWHKPNPMPESVQDRCTKSHEYIFLLSKNPRYYFDREAIQESANEKWASRYNSAFNCGKKERAGSGRKNAASNTAGTKKYTGFKNKRDVWTVTKANYRGAHFATFPEDLIKPCILAGSRDGGVVLDPFCGSGTTLAVANKYGRNGIGIELNVEYAQLVKERVGEYTSIYAEESDTQWQKCNGYGLKSECLTGTLSKR